MSETLRILVTGTGGDLAQAIIKCLNLMNCPLRILGCDIEPDGIGPAFTQDFFQVPPADRPDYLDRIVNICVKNHVHAIIPGSVPEMYVLSRALLQGKIACRASLICQEYEWLERFGDKLTCFEALEGKVNLAPYASCSNKAGLKKFLDQHDFPCIVKSRRSWGSKSVNLVYNEDQLFRLLQDQPDLLIQEFIDKEYGEFSVGVFACNQFRTAIAFKRELGPVGASWYADNLDQDHEVLDYSVRIAEISGLQGSCNVQVRKGAKGVRLLEINPRFSSLVAARAACGFRDLEWSLLMALGMKISEPALPFRPLRFRRYFHELIDTGEGYFAPDQWIPRHKPLP